MSKEGFSFIRSGYPLYEGLGGVEGGHDSPFYFPPYFPRPSVRDGRIYDLNDMTDVNNIVFWVGSITLASLLIGGIVLVSSSKP
jgi:hypothetical protein